MINIRKPSDVCAVWNQEIGSSEEQFIVVLMNEENNMEKKISVTQGIKEYVLIEIDKIIECCCILGATSIAISHNHPSGNLLPSDDDIDLTNIIIKKCKEADINFFDHVIVTSEGNYLSMRNIGIF